MKFQKVSTQDEINKVLESQSKLKNNINARAIDEKLKQQVMDDALNRENEITTIKEKLLFNDNLDEINEKRQQEGLEPLQPKALETSLQKEQIARKGLDIDIKKQSVKNIGLHVNKLLNNIQNIKRDESLNPNDSDDKERLQKLAEIRYQIETALTTPQFLKQPRELEKHITKKNRQLYDRILDNDVLGNLDEFFSEIALDSDLIAEDIDADQLLEELEDMFKDDADYDDADYDDANNDKININDIKSNIYTTNAIMNMYKHQIQDPYLDVKEKQDKV